MFKTIDEQVEDLRSFSANPRQRIRTGLESIDVVCEGPAAGEVFMILGRSFSGKSLAGLNVLANNPSVPMLFFSLEMPARQCIQRLFSMWSRTEHQDVVRMTNEGSLPKILDELGEAYPSHIIVDKSGLTYGDMSIYLEQFDEYIGERPAAVVIDYLELVGGGINASEGYTRTESLAKALKDWAKDEEVAVFILHQTNRSEPEWEPPHADSARGAGYTESDAVIGLWRPWLNPKLGDHEREMMRDEVWFNVIKNRITGRVTGAKGLKFSLRGDLKLRDLDAEATRRYWNSGR